MTKVKKKAGKFVLTKYFSDIQSLKLILNLVTVY